MKRYQSQNGYHDVDRGYAWVYLSGVVTAAALQVGLIQTLGSLLPIFRDQFSTSTWLIGLTVSLSNGVGIISGPVVGGLSKVFGARPVVMVTGGLCACGLIICSQAWHIYALVFPIILTGGSTNVLNVLIGKLSCYFHKYYSRAISIATIGISLGIMGSAPLTQLLLETYGWRGTLLIWSAFSSHFVFSGALLRPTSKIDDKKCDMVEKDNLQQKENCVNSVMNKESQIIILGENKQHTQRKLRFFVKYLDLSLFTEYSFIVLLIMVGCLTYTLTGWLIYIVPYALSENISPYQASYLATSAGIGNLCSKLATPAFQKVLSNRVILYATVIMQAMSMVATGIFKAYIGLLMSSVIYGIAIGAFTVAFYVELHNVAGKERSVNAVTWSAAFNSACAIASGWSTGWFFDTTGNYTLSFVLLGAAQTVALMFMLSEDVFRFVKPTKPVLEKNPQFV